MEVQYFCVEGWTGVIGLKWLKKIEVLARRFFAFGVPERYLLHAEPRWRTPLKKKVVLEGGFTFMLASICLYPHYLSREQQSFQDRFRAPK